MSNPPTGKIAKHSVAWMQALAQLKREMTKNELEHMSLMGARMLKALHKEYNRHNLSEAYPPENIAEYVFDDLQVSCARLGYTEENFWHCQRLIIHKLYVDPTLMYKSTGDKHHAVPYWNPTAHNINIHALGLIDEIDAKTREARVKDIVPPGERVMIPTIYTLGGKYSSLQGVAPQLKPLPRQVDQSLDLSPLTYTEWCTFGEAKLSQCCNKLPVWRNSRVCKKCGKDV